MGVGAMRSAWGEAGKVAAIYALFGLTWTLISDQVLAKSSHDKDLMVLRQKELGWAFLALSALFLFALAYQFRRRLLEAQERNTTANKLEAVGLMAGGIAHDFNNVLTVVGGMTELARDATPSEDPKRGMLDHVLAMIGQAKSLILSLTDFLRRKPPERCRQDLAQLVRSNLPLLKLMVKPSVTLISDLNAAPVLAENAAMARVLTNLVVNADHAMPKGGQLTISSRTEDGWSVLSVRDSGDGIDEKLLGHIYEVGLSTKGEKGSGLGLASVASIVSGMGGHINVISSRVAGTRFDLSFPTEER